MIPPDHYSLDAVRKGLVSMICGRIVSAALTFLTLLTIAHDLDVAEYGVYSMLLSILGLSLIYAGLGLDWISARYLPEYRANAGTPDVRRFVSRFLAARFLSLCALALALLAGIETVARWFNIAEWTAVLGLYLAVIVLEGQVRSVRGDIFEPLLLQGHSQINATVRALVFAGAVWVLRRDGLSLVEVVVSDLASSGVSLVLAQAQLAVVMRRRLGDHDRREHWQPPPIRDVVATAGYNYTAQLIASLASTNTLLLIGAALIGPASVAGFGFCRTLAEQIYRYLPTQLLISVVRPKIVAAFSLDRRLSGLLESVHLLYKGNLIILMPLVIVSMACGDLMLDLLSGGRYRDAWPIASTFAVLLVLQSHQGILALTTNIIGRPGLITLGAIASTVSPLLAVLFLHLGLGPKGLALALLVGEASFHVVVVALLRRRGFAYTFDKPGFARLFLSAGMTLAITLLALHGWSPAPPDTLTPDVLAPDVLAQALVLAGPVLLFALLSLVFWPFSLSERTAIARLFRIRLPV